MIIGRVFSFGIYPMPEWEVIEYYPPSVSLAQKVTRLPKKSLSNPTY
jgi:hypothetical protein